MNCIQTEMTLLAVLNNCFATTQSFPRPATILPRKTSSQISIPMKESKELVFLLDYNLHLHSYPSYRVTQGRVYLLSTKRFIFKRTRGRYRLERANCYCYLSGCAKRPCFSRKRLDPEVSLRGTSRHRRPTRMKYVT